MELSERIKLVMQSHNLSASAFAQKLDVQRSGISHILSGRNKPGIDFLQKLLRAFPKVDASWLLLGDEAKAPSNDQKPHAGEENSQKESPRESSPQQPQKHPANSPVRSEEPVAIALFFSDGTFEYHKPKPNGE